MTLPMFSSLWVKLVPVASLLKFKKIFTDLWLSKIINDTVPETDILKKGFFTLLGLPNYPTIHFWEVTSKSDHFQGIKKRGKKTHNLTPAYWGQKSGRTQAHRKSSKVQTSSTVQAGVLPLTERFHCLQRKNEWNVNQFSQYHLDLYLYSLGTGL